MNKENTIRAKFRCESIESSLTSSLKPGKNYSDPDAYQRTEMRTLKFNPVYANGDQNHENNKFWNATPSGSIQLGVVNQEAWKHFQLDKEYYIDFIPCE